MTFSPNPSTRRRISSVQKAKSSAALRIANRFLAGAYAPGHQPAAAPFDKGK
jgi:hypothetical protein